MPLPEVEEIIQKYKLEEDKINKLSQKTEDKALLQNNKNQDGNDTISNSIERARVRNKTMLKDLETVKASLRSRAIFSPTEMQWEEICRRYKEEPSLPVTTWKCHLPIYV